MDSFVSYVLDCLSVIGQVTSRKMFGGYGFYLEETMFALLADGVLFFKVDQHNQGTYEEAGMQPFTYEGKSKPVKMSYWQLPEEILEDQDQLKIWAEAAFAAAKRNKKPKKMKKKR